MGVVERLTQGVIQTNPTPDNDTMQELLFEERPNDAAQANVNVGTWVKAGLVV